MRRIKEYCILLIGVNNPLLGIIAIVLTLLNAIIKQVEIHIFYFYRTVIKGDNRVQSQISWCYREELKYIRKINYTIDYLEKLRNKRKDNV